MRIETLTETPARWYTLLGLVLVPLLVAGGFLLAGVNADSRLHTVRAAVVNLDEPVTLDGQYTPLGRQLTANLVDSDRTENLTWELAAEDDARAGLATGEYAAMVVIPENFSAAATSFAENDADTAEQATIQVHTSPVAGVADATLGRLVASEAAAMLNSTLTESYLDGIYIGFNDLGDQFVTLADASGQLADGTEELSDGIGTAADGARQLYTGTRQLADGLGTMARKTRPLPSGTRTLADGAGELAGGVKQYVGGVNRLVDSSLASAEQLPQLTGGISQLSRGASGVSSGLNELRSTLQGLTQDPTLGGGIACPEQLQQAGMCDAFYAGVATGGGVALRGLTTEQDGATLVSGAAQVAGGLEEISSQLSGMAPEPGATEQLLQLKAAGTQLRSGTAELADGADELADGMPALVSGIRQSADGAGQLATGVDEFAAGLIEAHDGSTKLADGMREMADGIAEGKDKVPTYSKADRESLATVVAAPVDTSSLSGLANPNVGWISLVLVLALWLGALATYAVVRAVGAGLLSSAEPTAVLIGRSLLPGLVVVGVQAVLVAALSRFGLELSGPQWLAVTGVLLLAGATFVVVNHALVAWLGGIGRLVSVALAVLTTASALVGAAPAVFAALRPFSPLTPALDAVRAIATDSGGATIATLTLVGWLLLAFTASAVAIARRRTTTLSALVAAS